MKLGDRGEALAAEFLVQKGYTILVRNFRTPIGEIDIVAQERDTLVFVEVKTRESLKYGHPFEAVTRKKRNKLAAVALLYLKQLREVPSCRFDIVSVYHEEGRPAFNLIRDAFEV